MATQTSDTERCPIAAMAPRNGASQFAKKTDAFMAKLICTTRAITGDDKKAVILAVGTAVDVAVGDVADAAESIGLDDAATLAVMDRVGLRLREKSRVCVFVFE